MGFAHETDSQRDISFHRAQNLLLIAQFRVRWPKSDELERTVRELRTAYPAGSAIMNFVAGRDGTGVRAAWVRLASVFLVAAGSENARRADLGTAHLVEPVGLQATAMRLLFRVLERRGGDFAKHGNKIVSTVEDAADLLGVRLANGPVKWDRRDLLDTIASFVRDNPLPIAGPASQPWR